MTDTPEKIVYTARATVSGGRKAGRAQSDDGVLDLSLTAPKETGGPGTGTNPEQLLAVGWGACFQSALEMTAKKMGIDASGTSLDVAIGFGPEGDSYALTAEISCTIRNVDDDTAQQLMEATHEVCPYSRATRGNVPVTLVGKGA